MSENFLNSNYGICVGGMFFKEGDYVHVVGRGYKDKNEEMEEDGKIMLIGMDNELVILTQGGWCVCFDYSMLSIIEHPKKTRDEWLKIIEKENK